MARRYLNEDFVGGDNGNDRQNRANQFTPVSGPPSGGVQSREPQLPEAPVPVMSVGERRRQYRQDLRERRTQSSPAFKNSVQVNNLAREAGTAERMNRYAAPGSAGRADANARLAAREQQMGVDTRADQYRQSADNRANQYVGAESRRMDAQGEAYRGQAESFRGQGEMYRGQGDESRARGRYSDALSQYQVPAQSRALDAEAGYRNAQSADIPAAAQDRRDLTGAQVQSMGVQDRNSRKMTRAQVGQIQEQTKQIDPMSQAQMGQMGAQTEILKRQAQTMGNPTLEDQMEAHRKRAEIQSTYPDYDLPEMPVYSGTPQPAAQPASQPAAPQAPLPLDAAGTSAGSNARFMPVPAMGSAVSSQAPTTQPTNKLITQFPPEVWEAEAKKRNITVEEAQRRFLAAHGQ